MTGVAGSLFGLAYGDALGAPTEFRTVAEITARYGPAGPRQFAQWFGIKPAAAPSSPEVAVEPESEPGPLRLLPEYDCYVMGFRERDRLVPERVRRLVKSHPKGRFEGIAAVHDGEVVPHQHVANLPLVAHREAWLGRVRPESVEQGLALRHLQTDHVGIRPPAEKQRLAAALRLGADQGMMCPDRSANVIDPLVSLSQHAGAIGRCVVHRNPAGRRFLQVARQGFIGGKHVGEVGIAARLRRTNNEVRPPTKAGFRSKSAEVDVIDDAFGKGGHARAGAAMSLGANRCGGAGNSNSNQVSFSQDVLRLQPYY